MILSYRFQTVSAMADSVYNLRWHEATKQLEGGPASIIAARTLYLLYVVQYLNRLYNST